MVSCMDCAGSQAARVHESIVTQNGVLTGYKKVLKYRVAKIKYEIFPFVSKAVEKRSN